MASGHAEVLELITCPVCRDIYTDPKSLRCRHILCSSCLDRLMLERRANISHNCLVKCPVCREKCSEQDIRDDFKVREMVALLGAQVRLPENHLCEWCENNKLRWRCTQCDALICHQCKLVHEKVLAKEGRAAKHELQSVEQLAEKLKGKLLEKKARMDKNLQVARHDLEEMRTYTAQLMHNRAQVLAEIDEEENRQLERISQSFDSLRLQACKAISDELSKTRFRMQGVQNAISGAHSKLSDMFADDGNEVMQSMTEIVVNYGGSAEGDVSLLSLNDQWHSPSPSLKVKYTIPQQQNTTSDRHTMPRSGGLVLSEENRSEEAGKVNISHQYDASSNETPPSPPLNILSSTKSTWQCEQEISLESYCHSFTQIRNELWCAQSDENKIMVYDADTGALNRCVQAPHIDKPTCVIDTTCMSGRVLIGCNYEHGLHELDLEGNYKQWLHGGSIYHGSVFNEEVYILSSHHQHGGVNSMHIQVLRHDGVTWQVTRDFELDYCRANHNDTLCVTSAGLSVGSWSNHSVLLYNTSGHFVRYERNLPPQEGGDNTGGGGDPQPRVCQADVNDHMLTTEARVGKVYCLTPSHSWKALPLDPQVGVRHALLSPDAQSLWLLTRSGTSILHYCVTVA